MRWRALCLLGLLPALLLPAAATEGPWRLGGEPRAYALDNGLSVILQQDVAAPITVVQLLVRSGDRDAPPGLSGMAYLVARLCLEIPDQGALQQLMDLGSSFSLAVGDEQSLVTIRCLSRHLDPTLAVLASMMGAPLFSDLRIDGVKDLMRHLQKMEVDDPDFFMRKTVAAAFYGDSASGAASFGTEASLRSITRKDVQSFFRSHFIAGNMIAVVISDLDEEEVRPLIAQRLGRLAAGERPPRRAVSPRRPPQPEQAVERRTAQTLVSVSMPLPERTADSFVLASLLESWLGKGIGSRLWRLRSRGELAYGLNAELQPNREAMLLSVYLKTENRRSAGAQAELARLLQEIHGQGVGADELASAKAYARAVFWRENETRERRAAFLAFLEGAGLSYRIAGDFAERLDKVGLEEFNTFLSSSLAPERWFTLRIGPAAGEANGSYE